MGDQGLASKGRAIVERLGGRWSGEGGLCRCPAHDDRSPSLSIRVGRSRLLFHCFAGCDNSQVLAALRTAGLGGDAAAASAQPHAGATRRHSTAALRLWGAARAIGGTLAARYIEGRGLVAAGDQLRFHPRTPHGPRPYTRFRPALIAAVRDESGLVGVHRTFIDRRTARLASLPEPKCGLGPFGRGAARLGGAARRMGLAEGIENALSASVLFGLPCWATLGTERFRHIVLPEEVRELVLFLDNDAGGRRAEALAREAFPHLEIEPLYAPLPGGDWNDVLMERLGRMASP